MGFFRYLPYFLCIFALNQALYANEGAKWLRSSFADVQKAADAKDPYAQGFLSLVYAHGDKGMDVSFENAKGWAVLSSQSDHWLGHFAMGYLARFPSDGVDNAQNVGRHYLKSFQGSSYNGAGWDWMNKIRSVCSGPLNVVWDQG